LNRFDIALKKKPPAMKKSASNDVWKQISPTEYEVSVPALLFPNAVNCAIALTPGNGCSHFMETDPAGCRQGPCRHYTGPHNLDRNEEFRERFR
jgi:hypothetical protein